MKVVLFDLDDTLYPEIEFVKSGFRSVARYLSTKFNYDEESLFARMLELVQRDGRGRVFDVLLEDLGIYTQHRVKLLIYLYRSHQPDINLYEDTLSTFDSLRNLNLQIGIITDGMGSVQRRKVAALGLDNLVYSILCTDELGKEHWKPSIVPYQITLELMDATPSEAVYVGDNPTKDFIGANRLGMMTIQVRRQQAEGHSSINDIHGDASAKFVVKKLNEILPIIGERLHA